jgi:hypothetical protein
MHYWSSLVIHNHGSKQGGQMGKHLRKLFSADQVKEVFRRYLARQIGVDQALAMLKIRRRQYFKLLKLYRDRPESFSLQYARKRPPRRIEAKAEAKMWL